MPTTPHPQAGALRRPPPRRPGGAVRDHPIAREVASQPMRRGGRRPQPLNAVRGQSSSPPSTICRMVMRMSLSSSPVWGCSARPQPRSSRMPAADTRGAGGTASWLTIPASPRGGLQLDAGTGSRCLGTVASAVTFRSSGKFSKAKSASCTRRGSGSVDFSHVMIVCRDLIPRAIRSVSWVKRFRARH
jgi:hypothetical protein